MYFQILVGFVLLAATAAAQTTAMLTGTDMLTLPSPTFGQITYADDPG